MKLRSTFVLSPLLGVLAPFLLSSPCSLFSAERHQLHKTADGNRRQCLYLHYNNENREVNLRLADNEAGNVGLTAMK
jgi:hypothetical protein